MLDSSKPIIIGRGECVHVMRQIANEINRREKIILVRSKKEDSTESNYLSPIGVEKVVNRFIQVATQLDRPVVMGNARFNAGDKAMDNLIKESHLPALARESMTVILNSKVVQTGMAKLI